MKKIKIISALIVFLVVFLLVKLPGEYAVITAGEVEGIICSDRYIDKVRHFGSINRFYVYKVRYTVNGQIYESDQFETGVDSYQMGDVVEITYHAKHPDKLVRKQIPISWFVFILVISLIVKELFKKEE